MKTKIKGPGTSYQIWKNCFRKAVKGKIGVRERKEKGERAETSGIAREY